MILILNAIGILLGFLGNSTVSGIFMGLSVLFLIPVVEKIFWQYFMEPFVDTLDVLSDTMNRLASVIIATLIVVCFYMVLFVKGGKYYAFAVVLLGMIYLSGKYLKDKKDVSVWPVIICLVELLLSLVFLMV